MFYRVTSRNVYSDTDFLLVEVEDNKLKITDFPNVGRMQKGKDFLNSTKGLSKSGKQFLLIGPHMDSAYEIAPTIITNIEEQRERVFDYLKSRYSTLKEESLNDF